MHTIIDARNPVWPTTSIPVFGVVYVATGRRFAEEAATAAAQLRLTNPDLSICLITDEPDFEPVFWDHLVVVEHSFRGFRDKILMGLCPYERFLYLDTDTHVVGDISPIFTLLERFEFAGHQLFEGNDCPLPNVSSAFNEFNGGVLGFRRCPALSGFFSRWLAGFDEFYALNRDGKYHYSNASDQKSLRLTVYHSELRIAILKPEYNFTPHHLDFACAEVRILHGRGRSHLDNLERRLNAKLGNRVYIPRLDAVIHNDPLSSELCRLWWMSGLQLVRKAARRLTPMFFRNMVRQSRLIRSLFLRNHFTESSAEPDPKWHQPSKPE